MARRFGVERTPLSGGSSRHTRSDSLHHALFIETKERARHAVWSLFDQVAVKARAEGKVPVLALAETKRRGFLVTVHVDDLEAVAQELALARIKMRDLELGCHVPVIRR